jgi:hypothetical protein
MRAERLNKIEQVKIEAEKKQAEEKAKQMEAVVVSVAPAPTVVSGCGDNELAHYIYMKEPTCNTSATNSIGCYGIGQDCNSVLRTQCGSDYGCQNDFFNKYAVRRYGSWQGAYNFWLDHHWW